MNLLSFKTVIRTKSFEKSKSFYADILNMKIVKEYDDGDGSMGCILRFGGKESNAFLEISEIRKDHYYYQDAFARSLNNDKIDIQLKTDDVCKWAIQLGKKWACSGPVDRPWGAKYLYLRDPDGLQIIIYQEDEL